MSAGITTTKKRSKVKPRMEKEKPRSPLGPINSACRAADSLDDGEHVPRGEHLLEEQGRVRESGGEREET
jgi:hypothetical protein